MWSKVNIYVYEKKNKSVWKQTYYNFMGTIAYKTTNLVVCS